MAALDWLIKRRNKNDSGFEDILVPVQANGVPAMDANGNPTSSVNPVSDTERIAGWISAGETWTYASATTFTAPGDLTTKYAKGDRIRLVQTTAKYFVLIGISHSAGTTTFTVTAGTDYTLANAAITSPYWSKEVNPVGWPEWFAFTVGFTGFSANPTGMLARFRVLGNTVHVTVRGPNAGTSNATTFTLTGLPITAKAVTNYSWIGPVWGQNAGTTVLAFAVVDPSTSIIALAVASGGSGWTNTGNKACHIANVSYEF